MTGSRWDSWPSHASQEYFESAMKDHSKVARVDKLSPSRWDLTLTDGAMVKVFITDVYTFSVSDYAELRAKHPDVTCIASASSWNHFSDQARDEAADEGIETVHLGAELMSALHRVTGR